MSETIDLPSSLAGFTFAFADDDQHKHLVLEINHGSSFVMQISAENYPTSFEVEWPTAGIRQQCAKIDYDKLMEALTFGQRILALRLMGLSKTS
jgi:hypothetical protein